MPTTSFALDVSYSQIAVFDCDLARPLNGWTDRHVNQGFAWRVGSVSFGTIATGGRHVVELVVTSEDVESSPDAVRIIQVPFEVPSRRSIEVSSIADAHPLELPSGMYALRYEYLGPNERTEPRVRLVFIKKDNPTFDVLRADAALSLTGELLLEASPA
jgi:hypothetical protein